MTFEMLFLIFEMEAKIIIINPLAKGIQMLARDRDTSSRSMTTATNNDIFDLTDSFSKVKIPKATAGAFENIPF